jgi:signal transduction histidine kinase/ligand-binding sensor domain-containing protein
MLLPVLRRACLLSLRHLIAVMVFSERLLSAAFGATPSEPEYLIDVKDTEHNLPSSIVTSIAQTPEGYLWVGTYNGLARFNGERFINFDPVNRPQLSHARVQGLYVDARGTLWINTLRGGLTSYRDGNFQREWPDDPTWFDVQTTLAASTSNSVTFVTQFGDVLRRLGLPGNTNWVVTSPPPGSRPFFQCAGPDGRLWFLTREQHVLRFNDGEFKELPPEVTLNGTRFVTMVTDAKGHIWAGTSNQVALWNGERFEVMTPTNGEPSLDQVTFLFPTSDGAMWVLSGDRFRKMVGREWVAEATPWRGLLGSASNRAMGAHEDRDGGIWLNHYGNGLFHITPGGEFQHLTSRDGLPGDRIGAWFQSRDGGIWLGVDRGGLVRLRERRFHIVGPAEGLTARTALTVCEASDGAMWIGAGGGWAGTRAGGLCRWDGTGIKSYSVGGSVSSNFVFSVFPRRDGGLWLSASEGEDLYTFRNDQIQHAPWELHGVKSIMEDRTGRLWLGIKSGLAWWSPTGGRRLFGRNDGMALSAVRALAEGPDGKIWSGADDGTLYRCEPDRLQAFRSQDALSSQPMWSLYVDSEGTVWAGTFRGGLLRFKNGKFFRFTIKQGLSVDVISQILEDNQGRLWLGTHQGIYSVQKSALNACADGKIAAVEYAIYGRVDGLPTLECSDGYQPACWKGSDGRLWFTTVKGVVSVNPRELPAGSIPQPVIIEALLVDGEPFELKARKIVIPPGHKQFEFRFAALNFDVTRFRYRIDGVDNNWVDSTERSTARYGHLSARDYTFRVIACDSKGVWHENGPSLAFTVQPYFYETWWFIVLMSSLVLGTVAFGVRTAAKRKYQRELNRLEQQHAIERDRARIAKDIHDDIGAGLTQITLLTELARREKGSAGLHLDRITDSARQLTRAMDEIVWAVDPQHDTFNGLIDYISAFAEDFLRTAGIRCRMDLPTVFPAIRIDAELRYHLFLAVKETLNNIVKHARADEVWLRLQIDPDSFALIVEDNGSGFSSVEAGASAGTGDRISSGSGLLNLQKRLSTVGGRCVIQSTPGQGTRVELTIRAEGLASPIVGIGHEQNPS